MWRNWQARIQEPVGIAPVEDQTPGLQQGGICEKMLGGHSAGCTVICYYVVLVRLGRFHCYPNE